MNSRLQKNPIGFYELAEKTSAQELKKYYEDKYYQEAKGSYELEYTPDELKYFKVRLEQHEAVINACHPPSKTSGTKSFLDVGCGEGYAMSYFRRQGYSVRGLDFSSAGMQSKNPECLDSLITGDVGELLQAEINSSKCYDVIWLQNVLEHVLDPVELLRALRNLVSPEGIAVITVPNDCSNIQREALERGHIDREFWVVPPDHQSYFDNEGLANIACETGWHVMDLLGDFPIDWYLYHPGSNYVSNPSVGKDAHWARVQLELLFSKKPIEDVLGFKRGIAKIGSGRDLTIFVTPRID